MTTFEALVFVSETLLKANGHWSVDGIDQTLRLDIAATVTGAVRLFRAECRADQLTEMAIAELERRAMRADTTNMHLVSIDDEDVLITPDYSDALRTFKRICRENPKAMIEWNKNCPLEGRMVQLGNYVPEA